MSVLEQGHDAVCGQRLLIGGIGLIAAEGLRSRVEPREASGHGAHPQCPVMVDQRSHHAIVRQTACITRLMSVRASSARAPVDSAEAGTERSQPQGSFAVLGEGCNSGALGISTQLMPERP